MFKIGLLEIKSRLLLGTGEFEDEVTQTEAIEAAEANVLAFTVGRTNLYNKNLPSPLANINLKDLITFPNTAGAKTTEEAIRIAEIIKRAGICDMIKVEMIGDDEILLPDPFGTYEACKVLLEKGYIVCPYISNDVVLAKRLGELGVHAVMPLASPVSTGRSINDQLSLSYIIRHSNVPVIADTGIGSPKGMCRAMELSADAILLNTTVSGAEGPVKVVGAMKLDIHADRLSYETGRILVKYTTQVSNPTEGLGFL